MTIEQRFYASVDATSELSSDYIIPSGKYLTLYELGASPAEFNSCVKITFDEAGTPDILLSATRESNQNTIKQFLGDGVKKLTIRLINTDTIAKVFGGYYLGDLT